MAETYCLSKIATIEVYLLNFGTGRDNQWWYMSYFSRWTDGLSVRPSKPTSI